MNDRIEPQAGEDRRRRPSGYRLPRHGSSDRRPGAGCAGHPPTAPSPLRSRYHSVLTTDLPGRRRRFDPAASGVRDLLRLRSRAAVALWTVRRSASLLTSKDNPPFSSGAARVDRRLVRAVGTVPDPVALRGRGDALRVGARELAGRTEPGTTAPVDRRLVRAVGGAASRDRGQRPQVCSMSTMRSIEPPDGPRPPLEAPRSNQVTTGQRSLAWRGRAELHNQRTPTSPPLIRADIGSIEGGPSMTSRRPLAAGEWPSVDQDPSEPC